MVICFLGIHINISRLSIFVCLLVFVQLNFVLTADANTTSTNRRLNRFLNKTKITTQITTTSTTNDRINRSEQCEDEVIDENLYYFSVGYRVFAGALVVPITICAICGNILVIYVIRRYPSLRVTGNVFLASLAVADVGVSTIAMTFYGLQLIYGRWLFKAVSLMRKSLMILERNPKLIHFEKKKVPAFSFLEYETFDYGYLCAHK